MYRHLPNFDMTTIYGILGYYVLIGLFYLITLGYIHFNNLANPYYFVAAFLTIVLNIYTLKPIVIVIIFYSSIKTFGRRQI